MNDDVNIGIVSGDAWHVSFAPAEEPRVVQLHVGDFMAKLSALEAYKLGSALRVASGFDVDPALCPHCPLCGQPPMMVVGDSQAFCGNDDCKALQWELTISAAEQLRVNADDLPKVKVEPEPKRRQVGVPEVFGPGGIVVSDISTTAGTVVAEDGAYRSPVVVAQIGGRVLEGEDTTVELIFHIEPAEHLHKVLGEALAHLATLEEEGDA